MTTMGDSLKSIGKILIIAVYATSFLLFSENNGNQMEAFNREIIGTLSCLAAICHDLAKRLSHYLYFFFFLLPWTYYTERSVGKYHIT